MIQRIQSIWLLLAALVSASTLYFNYYKLPNGEYLNLQNNFLGILLIGLSALIALVALFSFKKRKAQLSLIWFGILSLVATMVVMFLSISTASEKIVQEVSGNGMYHIGAFIPIIAIIFFFMARTGIRKDLKLLKSYDRLR